MIVRETEAQAREAAQRLVSKLDDEGFAEENLWTGVGRARSGAGAAIVGDPDQVVAKLRAYQDVGIDAFVLSGYTHIAEYDLVARYVLPEIEHSALKPRWK